MNRVKSTDFGLLIIRLIFLFLVVQNFTHIKLEFEQANLIALKMNLPSFITYFFYAIKVICPIFIIFGIFTQIAGLLLFLYFAFYIYASELDLLVSFSNQSLQISSMFLLLCLALFFCGSGRLALKRD